MGALKTGLLAGVLAMSLFAAIGIHAQVSGDDDALSRAKLDLMRTENRLRDYFTEFHDPILQRTLLVPNDVDPKRWSTLKRNTQRGSQVDVYPILSADGMPSRLFVMISLVGGERAFDIKSLLFNAGAGPAELPIRGSLKGQIEEVMGRSLETFRHEWVVEEIPDSSQASKALRSHGMPKTVRVYGKTHYLDHDLDLSERNAWESAIEFIRAERMLKVLTMPLDQIVPPSTRDRQPPGETSQHSPREDRMAQPEKVPHEEPSLFNDGDLLMMGVDPEKTRQTPPAQTTESRSPAASVRVDLNSATLEQLDSLPGIGPKLASEIIKHRPFRTFSDLLAVPGIGEKTLRAIEPHATVSPTGESLSR
jgi:competence ComEA-like helix-hairpin-helix protein